MGAVPRVSVGVPVFNGAETLRHALDSILGQTFTDLEVIVSDNASDDGSYEIAKDYAARDARVRVHRNDSNLGGRANFNRIFSLARGEYFKWAAHDDWIAPDFLERCVRELEAAPDAVLCYASMCRVDAQGGTRRLVLHAEPLARSDRPHHRFRDVLTDVPYFAIFGLFRADALRRTDLIPYAPDPDRILLGQTAWIGQFRQLSDVLFFARSPQRGGNVWHWLDPAHSGKDRLSIIPIGRTLFRSVLDADITASEKLWSVWHIPTCLLSSALTGKIRVLRRKYRIAYGEGPQLSDGFVAEWEERSAASNTRMRPRQARPTAGGSSLRTSSSELRRGR